MTRSALWRRIKRDYGPYLPLSPYLLVVLFPFYWMIITTFKRDNDLYNLTGVPFWFKESPTLSHIQLLLNDTLFITWLKNSLLIGAAVVVITLVIGLPAAYGLAAHSLLRQPDAVHRDVPVVPDPSRAALPAAVPGGAQDRLRRFHLVAHPGLSVLHPALLHLAAHGLRPHGAGRDRGERPAGRVHALSDLPADRHPRDHSRHHHRRDLRIHADLSRVHLCHHLRLGLGQQDHFVRRHHRSDPGRRFLLGLAHGRRVDRRRSRSRSSTRSAWITSSTVSPLVHSSSRHSSKEKSR